MTSLNRRAAAAALPSQRATVLHADSMTREIDDLDMPTRRAQLTQELTQAPLLRRIWRSPPTLGDQSTPKVESEDHADARDLLLCADLVLADAAAAQRGDAAESPNDHPLATDSCSG